MLFHIRTGCQDSKPTISDDFILNVVQRYVYCENYNFNETGVYKVVILERLDYRRYPFSKHVLLPEKRISN